VEIPATVHAPNQTNKNKMTTGFFLMGIEIRTVPSSREIVERIGYGEITGVIDFEEDILATVFTSQVGVKYN